MEQCYPSIPVSICRSWCVILSHRFSLIYQGFNHSAFDHFPRYGTINVFQDFNRFLPVIFDDLGAFEVITDEFDSPFMFDENHVHMAYFRLVFISFHSGIGR
jgi:hypothetical protein